MAGEYRVTVEAEPKAADMGLIVKALTEFNASKSGGDKPAHLLITVRDEQNAVVGGLVASCYLGWLQVHAVWLPEEFRGKGLGRALMREAENEAIRRGCPRIFLETLSFQALPFYEKLGYTIFSCLRDFPPGSARYALTKILDVRQSPQDAA